MLIWIVVVVSIHAPPGGRDDKPGDLPADELLFQSTRPLGGATYPVQPDSGVFIMFQSTRPLGGATQVFYHPLFTAWFQSTRPLGGATRPQAQITT